MNDKLDEIDHIVVLMLENRSFDHMLGYLSLEGGRTDIDGLDGTQSNEYMGNVYRPEPLSDTVFGPDPHHDWSNVQRQLGDENGGFIQNFATVKNCESPERIMHYFGASEVPTFEHLAKQFCVCDRWFSSLPAATQPNRMYCLAGTSNGEVENRSPLLAPNGWDVTPIFEFLPDTVTWRYYSHDVAALRFVKGYLTAPTRKITAFYKQAKDGTLPNVCWIDPDFGYLTYPGPANDDHPEHDISHGQNLIRRVYNALLTGPKEQWEKTLLVVVYDEHGGFYDHVSPTLWTPDDNYPDCRVYGVRVPAMVISPWVKEGVAYGSQSHHLSDEQVIFDHTSILKTILLRFCKGADADPPSMTSRVDGANSLGALLTEDSPRSDCTPAPELPFEITWKDRLEVLETVTGHQRRRVLVRKPPTEMEQAITELANQAIAAGVPVDEL